MKKILPAVLFSLSLLIGACSTMPAEIEDRYLSEKSDAQSANISAIEQKIINKNKEKQGVEIKIKDQAKLPAGTEEEIKLLKEENGLIKDQIYFYEKNKDAVNIEAKKAQLAENETKLARKTALFQYHQEEKKLFAAELDLKNAELAQYISELNAEKSKIAAEYRDKNEPPKPVEKENFFTKTFNKKDPNDKYGYKKYGEHLEKKKQETAKAEADYREAQKKFQDAKTTLDKTK